MTRKLTAAEQALLDLWLWPLRATAEAVKDEWRRRRAKQREDLGLPPWEREDAE